MALAVQMSLSPLTDIPSAHASTHDAIAEGSPAPKSAVLQVDGKIIRELLGDDLQVAAYGKYGLFHP